MYIALSRQAEPASHPLPWTGDIIANPGMIFAPRMLSIVETSFVAMIMSPAGFLTDRIFTSDHLFVTYLDGLYVLCRVKDVHGLAQRDRNRCLEEERRR